MDYGKKIRDLLLATIEKGASDLHISAGSPPTIRVGGVLLSLSDVEKTSPEDSLGIASQLMDEAQKERFLEEKEIDFSYDFEQKNRFRVNVFFQRGAVSCSLRLVSQKIKTIEELNLPPVFNDFIRPNQGFLLVTGPSSHGKSTTLAALVDRINHTQFKRIITIEDPIEYIFLDDKSVIEQREVHYDTLSFHQALKSVFRQDPDVIMVGEMRDPETIATAITAAETGHLVLSTLHTNSASQTIHRILDSFSPERQSQVRSQLASSLLGVISQRLVPRIGGGLIPACEIMVANAAIGNIIRENKIHELDLIIETSAAEGMVSLNKSLADLIQKDKISIEDALAYSRRPSELRKFIS